MLGTITEFALILNINSLVKITQSLIFWGIIMCVTAIFSKGYFLSLLNPTLIMTMMNITYYSIRLIKSGYTQVDSCIMFIFTGIAGSFYIGNIVYIIKNKFFNYENKIQKYTFIFMTLFGLIFTILGFYGYFIGRNLFYNISTGVILGFIIGFLIANIRNLNINKNI